MELITLKNIGDIPLGIDERKIHFIIHKIIGRSLFSNNKDESLIGCELPSNSLKDMIGNSYKKHVDYLLNSESRLPVLLTDNQYIKGEKSKSYFINPLLLKEGLTNFHLKNGAIKRKLVNKNSKEKRTELDHFKFDHELAINKLKELIKENGELKLWSQLYVINAIKNGDYWYFRDLKGQRLHHPFTCLKKELRKHISSDNQPLVGIDLKNAQPFLLASILNHCFFSPQKEMALILSANPIIEAISVNQQLVNQNSLMEFIRYSVEGSLYEQIQLKLESRMAKNWTRNQVKQKFIISLFSNRDNMFTRVLIEEFPDVMDFIHKMQKISKAELANILQRLESYIFIDRIASEVNSFLTNNFYTVHDSIYVKESFLSIVKEICQRNTKLVTGFTGTFSIG